MGSTTDSPRFADRIEAGRQLAERLLERGVRADVVLAIPRGGLPAGRAVADALDAPLDVAVASKIGAPHNPELAIGAAASDGSVWIDEAAVRRLGVDDEYVERERRREAENARTKAARYRGGEDPPELSGASVVVVDDGVATGSTAVAAMRLARERGADRIVFAAPVGPPEAVADLREVADEVVLLATPSPFGAVGRFYERFDQVTDEEAMAYLSDDG